MSGVHVLLTGWHEELVPAIPLFGMVVVDAVRTLCAVILKSFFQNALLHLFLHGLVDDACSGLRRQEQLGWCLPGSYFIYASFYGLCEMRHEDRKRWKKVCRSADAGVMRARRGQMYSRNVVRPYLHAKEQS